MAETLKQMSGDEFVQKLLAGERDFRRVKLQHGYDVSAHERFGELKDYLRKSEDDLQENPVNLIGAVLSYVTAPELHLPYLTAPRASFQRSNFLNCNFHDANFGEANFMGASLFKANFINAALTFTIFERADLSNANLSYANLRNANLNGACLYSAALRETDVAGAEFGRTDLSDANLERVKNLGHARYLHLAHFFETKVSKEDVAVAKRAVKGGKSLALVYKSFWNS